MNDIEQKTDFEIDIASFVRRCIVRWKLAAFIAFGFTVMVAIVSLFLTNTYKCSTKIVFQRSGSALSGNLGTLASLAGVDAGAKSNDPSLYFQDVIKSTAMGTAILDNRWKASLAVKDTSTDFFLNEFWKVESDTTKPLWKERQQERLLKRLQNAGYIESEQDKKSGVITLTTRFEDPRLAYDVNRFVVAKVNEIVVSRSIAKASENRKFVEERLKQVRVGLENAEEALRSYLDSNRVRSGPDLQLRESRLQRNLQINQEVYLQLVKQREMAEIEEAKDLPVLDVIDQQMTPIEKAGPKRRIIVMAGAAVGGVFGLLFAGLWSLYAENRKGFWKNLMDKILQDGRG